MEGSLMAYTVFANGNVLNASQLNDNLMNQSVIVFGSDLARDSAIPAPPEGMVTYLEDVKRYTSYNGSDWVSPFAMELVKKHDIGTAATSINVTDAFSEEFDNYKIIASGGVGSVGSVFANMVLGSTTTGYYLGVNQVTYAGVGSVTAVANGASMAVAVVSPNGIVMNQDIIRPYQNARTIVSGFVVAPSTGGNYRAYGGFVDNAISYTDFTLNVASGTLTGGTVYVYGYKKA
jgi:hypothetical protein